MKRRAALKYLVGTGALALAGGLPGLGRADEKRKKIVFIAGRKSHGYGAHEHNAGCLLLADRLSQLPNVEAEVYRNAAWPRDSKVLEGADALVIYCDGGDRHVMIPHEEEVAGLMKKGVGLACLHYALHVPKGPSGDKLKQWIGGYYETSWSVNPFWTAEFKQLPDHPVTHGVRPFSIYDEWYYHMRFKDGMEGVTPILSAVPPKETLDRPDGPHSGNPHVRKTLGRPQHLLWVVERPDGGRGMGLAGGDLHWNWGDDNFRTAVLNGIAWIAKIDVSPDGIPSKTPTLDELKTNQDDPAPRSFTEKDMEKLIHPSR